MDDNVNEFNIDILTLVSRQCGKPKYWYQQAHF